MQVLPSTSEMAAYYYKVYEGTEICTWTVPGIYFEGQRASETHEESLRTYTHVVLSQIHVVTEYQCFVFVSMTSKDIGPTH